MKHLSKLRKEICLGKLVWVRPPSRASAAFFTKKLLNGLGVQDKEMTYLTASQFIQNTKNGFNPEDLESTRFILIGDLERLPLKTRPEFLQLLTLHKILKFRFDISLIVIWPQDSDFLELLPRQLNPYLFQIFEESDPIGINESVHGFIERASIKFKKEIWSLSPIAAKFLESIFLSEGAEYTKRLIFRAVQCSSGKQLSYADVSDMRQKGSSTSASMTVN